MASILSLISWRRMFIAAAYLIAVIVAPLLIGTFNYYNKAALPGQPMEPPAFSGALPAPPTPDPSKKIAVILTNVHGAEITDTLPPFEILARSGIFNVYSVAPERAVIPLMPGPVRGPTGLDFVPHFSFTDYDATLQDLARTRHGAVAQTIASSLFYPADAALFAAAAWPVRDLLRAAMLILLGAGVVFGATHVKLPRRARLHPQPQPA